MDDRSLVYCLSGPSENDVWKGKPLDEDADSLIQVGMSILPPSGMTSPAGHPASGEHAETQLTWQSSLPPLVTVFSAECSSYNDWQTVTLYQSWKKAGIPGHLVRLLACSEEKRGDYKRVSGLGEDLLTHVHENKEQMAVGEAYPPLNKPWGLKSWLEGGSGSKFSNDTVIMIVDPDFSFGSEHVLAKLAPIVATVGIGVADAVGVDYEYVTNGFISTNWSLPRTFNSSIDVQLLQSIGPPMLIRKDKLSSLVHGWYSITLSIVQDPALHAQVHDGSQPAPWIAEMYGYNIAAAGWLFHQTQREWPTLEVPQPPYAKTGEGDVTASPMMLHYSHPFSLCEKRFGKKFLAGIDVLDCDEHYPDTDEFVPPTLDELHSDSCKCCLSAGDVLGKEARCFGPDDYETIVKTISWEAWSRVSDAVLAWRSQNCAIDATVSPDEV